MAVPHVNFAFLCFLSLIFPFHICERNGNLLLIRALKEKKNTNMAQTTDGNMQILQMIWRRKPEQPRSGTSQQRLADSDSTSMQVPALSEVRTRFH